MKTITSNVYQSYPLYGRILTAILSILLLPHCSEQNQYVAPPPPVVTVAPPNQQAVTEYLEFTGTTQAVEFVEIRARVPGFLQSMHFEPGTLVQKDQLLFVIDPRPYEAELAAAEADLTAAEAELKRAEVELVRADALYKKKFISSTDHLKRMTERDTAIAAIARYEAKVQSARLQLSYTRVLSPITGRASRNMVDIGNLVGEGEATLLTSVTKFRPMYAYFHLNERDLLRVMEVHRKAIKAKGLDTDYNHDSEAEIPVFMGLATDTDYPYSGILDFSESGVNPDTGSMQLRAVFANSEKPPRLVPGLFVKLRFPVANIENALLIDEQAIASDQSGTYLLLVNHEQKVEKRAIVAGQTINGKRVIEKGLQAGDKVIVNGLQRARPGAKVQPQPRQSVQQQATSKKTPSENTGG